jgi:diguanylate cyclase (GGDEF)-like protein
MSLEPLDALSRLAERRFGSFADAATAVLDLLGSAVPGGCVLLVQVDWDAAEGRVLDSRGHGLLRGSELPLAREPETPELIDPEALAEVRAAPWASAALDVADGSVVGVLLAAAHDSSSSQEHLRRLLVIAARLLSYEWESVSTRAELRRLAESARDRLNTDPVTGLVARDALVEASEREWELSSRGTVESHVVVCHLRDRPEVVARHGQALADLILRDVAEVLAGGVRRTDHLGRVADDSLAAVLVGCKGETGALAFLHRAEQSLARVAAARPEVAALSYGTVSLTDAGSADDAIRMAEAAARAGQHVAPLRDPATVEAA